MTLVCARRARLLTRPQPSLLALAVLSTFAWLSPAAAQSLTQESPRSDEPLQLKPSVQLSSDLLPEESKKEPVFLSGDKAQGRTEIETVVSGNAELRKRSIVIKADRLEYQQPSDLAKAQGHVRILRDGNLFTGTDLELKVDAFEGFFLNPHYNFIRNGGAGQAERIDFIDEKRSIAKNASFTTCKDPGLLVGWMPDWVLTASKIHFDYEEEVGYAENGQLRFKDVPILATPSLTFPLTEKRKSGVLPPTINVDNISGVEVTLPYYWSLADNRDLTFFPNLKSKRGVNLGTEFRYLEPSYSGEMRADVMPHDKLRGMDRWGFTSRHSGLINTPLIGTNPIGMNVSLNRVSDDNYWRDFPRGTSSLTQRLLANDVNWNWQGDSVRAQLRTLKWQTLQDPSAPITSPYDKLPNLNVRFDKRLGGLNISAEGDFARFVADPLQTGQPNANRSYGLVALSYPFKTAGTYIIPKVQVHSTSYQFDNPVTQVGSFTGATRAARTVPTYSLDAGMVFEKPSSYFGRDFTQTLEPRAFWTKTPYRDQIGLPVYDTASRDFNFTSIWNENEYVGNDRISATNTLTMGAMSRLLDPSTGAENVRLTVAQRLRYSDQNVVLPGEKPATARVSDLLLGMGLNWNPKWQFDATAQYSPTSGRSVRTTVLARYSPSNYRVISAAYRLNQGASEQIDIGWQWPIDDLWRNSADEINQAGLGLGSGRTYSVGRINYSMQDRKVVDALFGFEYDSGCWLSRVVFERLQRSDATPNNRIMFQLEFVGFSRVGSNPVESLRTQIPGYQFLREKTLASPNRFTTYE